MRGDTAIVIFTRWPDRGGVGRSVQPQPQRPCATGLLRNLTFLPSAMALDDRHALITLSA